MARSNRSKTMQTFNRAADRTLTRVGNVTVKGIEKTAKWVATDHTGTIERSRLMSLEQSAKFGLARIGLASRRIQRHLDNDRKLFETGVKTTALEHIAGWIADYLYYILRLIWAFIGPIFFNIILAIFRLFLILLFNVIFFYALYLLITS